MTSRSHRWGSKVLVCLAVSGWVSCQNYPTVATVDQIRAVTTATVSEFLATTGKGHWPRIYVSDQFLPFEMDSAWISSISDQSRPIEAARRDDVTDSYDIVRDGGLLIEPMGVGVREDGAVIQALRFSATAQFGGQLEYALRPMPRGAWQVVQATVIRML